MLARTRTHIQILHASTHANSTTANVHIYNPTHSKCTHTHICIYINKTHARILTHKHTRARARMQARSTQLSVTAKDRFGVSERGHCCCALKVSLLLHINHNTCALIINLTASERLCVCLSERTAQILMRYYLNSVDNHL